MRVFITGAAGHVGFLAMFAAADNPSSSALTRQRLGWTPTQRGLIADLDDGHYFGQPKKASDLKAGTKNPF